MTAAAARGAVRSEAPPPNTPPPSGPPSGPTHPTPTGPGRAMTDTKPGPRPLPNPGPPPVPGALFSLLGEPLTVTDLDEWIAEVTTDRWDATYAPNEWARAGLGALLGEEIPYRLWSRADLLNALGRARSAVAAVAA